jgi:hypothetical protein
MMRLAKILAAELCCAWWPWEKNDHDIALDWLIDNGHYTPENS